MNCLSHEELLQVALGEASAKRFTEHVTECATCRTAVAEFQALDERLAAAHRTFGDAHETGKSRLLAALEQPDSPHPPDERRETLIPKMGGLTMAQRTAIGGVALAAMVAGVLLWVGSPSPRASAMERMAENVRRAKSYEVTMDMELTHPQLKNKSANGRMKFFWQTPGSYRIEETGGPDSWVDSRRIYPAGKQGLSIDHLRKEYRIEPARRGKQLPLTMVDGFGRFEGQADRELGKREIEGKQARGFEIAIKKVDPDALDGTMEIWIDEQSELPVLVRMMPKMQVWTTMVMHNFKWNVEFDPKLFDTTPPEGYTDTTVKMLSFKDRVFVFREGLATFAELSGGHYPRVKIIYGDVTLDEMKRLAKIDTPATDEQIRTDEYVKIQKAVRSFAMLNELYQENADVAYYGQTVEAKDKDKVLLRWQLDDGRYQVMYGDLRSETVSPERLRELEAM